MFKFEQLKYAAASRFSINKSYELSKSVTQVIPMCLPNPFSFSTLKWRF